MTDRDTDGDGWSDAQELQTGTDASNVDTDGDGYWDSKDANPLDSSINSQETKTTSVPAPTVHSTPNTTATTPPESTIQQQAQPAVFYQQNGLTLEYHWPIDKLNFLSAEETQIMAYNESDEAIEFIMPQMSFTENGSPRALTSGTWEKFPSRNSWDRIEQIFLLHSYQGEPLFVQPGEKAKIHWHLEHITSTDTNQSVALDLTVTTGARTETITLTLVRHPEQRNADAATPQEPTQKRHEH